MPNPKPKGGKLWQPGQAPNPKGSSALSRELGNIRKLNHVAVAAMITKFAEMSLNDLIAFAQNKDNKSLDIGIASIYINMIKAGDPSRMTLLLDRSAGKVKEQIEHQIVGSVQSQILDTIIQIEKSNKNGSGEE